MLEIFFGALAEPVISFARKCTHDKASKPRRTERTKDSPERLRNVRKVGAIRGNPRPFAEPRISATRG